jgi:hypothetical protein
MSDADALAVATVLEYWHTFNLEGRRSELDKLATLIGDNKDASIES